MLIKKFPCVILASFVILTFADMPLCVSSTEITCMPERESGHNSAQTYSVSVKQHSALGDETAARSWTPPKDCNIFNRELET